LKLKRLVARKIFTNIPLFEGTPAVKTSVQKTKNYNILGTISMHIISLNNKAKFQQRY
jgi:hypothetical protein